MTQEEQAATHDTPSFPQVVDFLKNRRSVPAKALSGPGPSDDEIETLIEIASRVPDHKKLAPWRFIHYSHPTRVKIGAKLVLRTLEKEGDLTAEQIDLESTRLTRAGAVIAVVSAPKDEPAVPMFEQHLSAGAAAMNLLLAANAIGFDAQWLTEWYAYDETLREDFGLNDGEQIAAFIHIGKRTAPKTERARPSLEEVYTVL